jgi:hypothetical protein
MTVTHIITVATVAVSAAVALIVAHLQRKQMRQIELYKQDPTVSLTPPPSALTRFVKSNWDIVLGSGGPVLSLTLELTSNAPLTRLSVFMISLLIGLVIANFLNAMIFRILDRMARVDADLLGVVKDLVHHTDIATDSLYGILKDHIEITKSHARTIENGTK